MFCSVFQPRCRRCSLSKICLQQFTSGTFFDDNLHLSLNNETHREKKSMEFAFVFFLLAYFFPKILKVPNRIWFKLGMFLGDIIAPVMMALIYFVAVVPTGIYARFAGKDILGKRRDQSTSTYWINRDDPAGTMKNQF